LSVFCLRSRVMERASSGVDVLAGLSAVVIGNPLHLGPNRLSRGDAGPFTARHPDINRKIKGFLLGTSLDRERHRDRVLLAVLRHDGSRIGMRLEISLKKVLSGLRIGAVATHRDRDAILGVPQVAVPSVVYGFVHSDHRPFQTKP